MNSIQKKAKIAGWLYLLLIPTGIFGILYVPTTLIVSGDLAATVSNIIANESLFRLSIVSALIVPIINTFVVLFLYKILKPVNKNHAVLMVIFLLAAVPIAYVNEISHFAILQLVSGVDYLTVFTADQVQALVPLFLNLHEDGINIAGIFWGLWLFPMGYLVFKSGYIPRILGVLLIIGGFGYLIDSLAYILFPNYGVTFAQYTFIGEILLPLWLVTKGVDAEQWEKRVLESA